MIDQSRVQSGFDIELLLSEEYIKHFLLTSMETGSIPWWSQRTEGSTVTTTIVHAPEFVNAIRLYEPHPDFVPHPFAEISTGYTPRPSAFNVTLLTNQEAADVRVNVIVSIVRRVPGSLPLILEEQEVHLDLRFYLSTNAQQRDVSINLELLDIDGPLIQTGESLPPEHGFDKQKILADMKAQLDRRVPLGLVGDNGAVQRIETRKFAASDGHPAALGIYVNLLLKAGPEPGSYVADRGDVSAALNFLPADEHLAFAFPAALYSRLATDIFSRLAEERSDAAGQYHHPLRHNDEVVGKLLSARVYPETNLGSTPPFTNVLVISVEGEYVLPSVLPDPNFHMRVRLVPKLQDNILTWEPDFDLDIPSVAYAIVASTLLSFVLPKMLALSLFLLAAKKVIEHVGEETAVPIIEGELGEASFFDAFPNNLTIEERRWDPTYSTQHQIVSLIENVIVNSHGLAFSAFDLRLGRQPKPVKSAAIRSEVRDESGAITGLLYRVADWRPNAPDATAVYPAVDRMPYVASVPPSGVERMRVQLTIDQALTRIQNNRLLGALPYRPYMIDEEAGQIYQILTLCENEIGAIRDEAQRLLYAELDQQHRAEFESQAHDELVAELGREPTPEEQRERYNVILSAAVQRNLDKRYRLLRERYLRLDMEPSEYAHLQLRGILKLEHEGLTIVRLRHGRNGPTLYYRDRPDGDEGDNLLFLPRYQSERIVRPPA